MQVTIIAGPRMRGARHPRPLLILGLMVVASAAAVAGFVGSGGGRSVAASIAAAYGYPRRCLTVTVAAGAPDYATAHLDRIPGCSPYGGYVNASFHRVGGSWRLVLDEGQLFVANRLLVAVRERREGSVPTGAADRAGP